MYALFCIFCFHHASWHASPTLTEVFPCSFLSSKTNATVELAKTMHGQHCSQLSDNFTEFFVNFDSTTLGSNSRKSSNGSC